MQVPTRFAQNDMISLANVPVDYDLAESVGPDLRLAALMGGDEHESLADLALSYRPTAGDPALRSLIAARQGVPADEVLVMAGGMQALFLLAFVLCTPGDDVVFGEPVFPNAKAAFSAAGAKVRPLHFAFEDGYRLDLSRLKRALSPQTKLLCLASPQNPNGVALGRQDVASILAILDDMAPDALLAIDETYREAVYGETPVRPSFAGLDPRIVTTASLSKCHGAPGLRIGWVTTGLKALYDQLLLGKFTTTIANSAVDEALAIRVLERQDDIIAERRKHLQSGLDRVAELVAEQSDLIEWVVPDAGALCCLRLKTEAFDDAAVGRFYDSLASRQTRVAGGSWFGADDRVFRLGFGLLAMPDLDEALSRLTLALREAAAA